MERGRGGLEGGVGGGRDGGMEGGSEGGRKGGADGSEEEREGRTGVRKKGRGGREGGARAKPGNQLVHQYRLLDIYTPPKCNQPHVLMQ